MTSNIFNLKNIDKNRPEIKYLNNHTRGQFGVSCAEKNSLFEQVVAIGREHVNHVIEDNEKRAIEKQQKLNELLSDDEDFIHVLRDAVADMDNSQDWVKSLVDNYRTNDDAEMGCCLREGIQRMAEFWVDKDLGKR